MYKFYFAVFVAVFAPQFSLAQNSLVGPFYQGATSYYEQYPLNDTALLRSGFNKEHERMFGLWVPRLYPHGDFSIAAEKIIDYAIDFNANASSYQPNTYSSYKWKSIGPFDTQVKKQGQIHRITFEPLYNGNQFRRIYAASFYGGLWRTEDMGENWSLLNTDHQLPITSVSDVAINYENRNMIFISTGNGDAAVSPLWTSNSSGDNPLYTVGIYRSMDDGDTWHPINDGFLHHFEMGGTTRRLISNPNNPDELFVATSKGIFRTENATAINPLWTVSLPSTSVNDQEFKGLEYKPGDPSIVYASGKDIYRFNGLTWSSLTGQGTGLNLASMPDNVPISRINIAVTPANPNLIYAYLIGEKQKYNVIKQRFERVASMFIYRRDLSLSSNQWQLITTRATNSNFTPAALLEIEIATSWMGFAVSPINENHVVVGTTIVLSNLNVITNTSPSDFIGIGQYNTAPNAGLHPDVHALVFEPSTNSTRLFSANHGGISVKNNRTNQLSNDWEHKNKGIVSSIIWAFDQSKTDKDFIVIGKQDLGVDTRVNYDWKNTLQGDGYGVGVLNGAMKIYHANINHSSLKRGVGQGSAQTEVSGAPTWDCQHSSSDVETRELTLPFGTFPVAYAPTLGKMIYGFSELYERKIEFHSTNLSATWKQRSDLNRTAPWPTFRRITEIEISKSNPSRIYIVTTGVDNDVWNLEPNLYWSDNFVDNCILYDENNTTPKSFQRITHLPTSTTTLLNRTPIITGIVSDPKNHDRIWITFTGFDENVRVFYSANGGRPINGQSSWVNWDPNARLKLPANNIVYQDGSNDRLFVATDNGVWVKDGTSDWEKFGDIPNVRVHELKILECSGLLRAATYGRGMWEVPLPPVSKLSLADVINSNTTWSNSKVQEKNLIIKSGNTLTINNNAVVSMHAKALITIEPGAKLIVINAKITNDCEGMWRGIEVHGNYSQNQHQNNQGMLILNNATIEYAEDAVMLWEIGNYNASGGIVQAVNSTFRNNGRGVEFMSYPNFNSASYFEKCTFKVDNQFPATHNFRAFVTMWNVKAVNFRGCEFDVQAPSLVFDDQHVFENRGYGILAYDANFTVTYHCPAGIDPCPTKQNGSFKNLKYAISAHTIDHDRPYTVAYTDFKDNHWGIHNVGVNNAVLVRNNFELGKQWSTYSDGVNYMGPSEGISIYTGTGFRIEENNFNPSEEFTNIAVGIVVSAAGEADNKAFRNNFNGIQYGSVSNYINRDHYGHNGLRFLCGNFNEVWFDNAIIPVKHAKYEGVRLHQLEGREYVSGNEYSAGNNFTQNPIYPEGNYLNHTDNLIYYWWHQGNGYPNNISVNRVSLTTQAYNAKCESNFNDGYTEERLDASTQLTDFIVQYGTLEAEYGNLLHNLQQQLDGGNTPSLLQTIYETWPQEAWELRADLLAHSPYLSQDALREAAHNENFPRAMLLEVLLANPDAHRNDHDFVKFLELELQPALPAYMLDLLMLSWEDMTLRTVLEAKMAAKAGDMAWRLSQIVNYYLTDSVNQDAQVEFWLNRALDLRSKYRLAWHHARKNQYSAALAVTNGLSTQFTLNQPQLAEKARFESLIAFKQSLGAAGLAGVNGEGIGWLESFVASTDDAFDFSLALAQNALQHQGSAQIHRVHLPESESQGRRAANKEQGLQQLREDLTVLKLYPNPANAYATLAFELPQEVDEATLVIADLTGKIVNRIPLNSKKGQQLIDTRNLPAGMYITSVVCKTGILKRDKLVISR